MCVVDRVPDRAREVATRFGCDWYSSCEELPVPVRAASVAVPTAQHASVALHLLERGIDVLVEKPLAPSIEDGRRIVDLARSRDRVVQVGHLERFNPVVEAAMAAATLPLFFEVHRMSPFSPRSLDVDVVLDLMIHDLDIVRALVSSKVRRVDASGLSVVSERTDIANARIQFQNGCVANLTASRVSTERVRKLRFFQPREYLSLDYISREGVRVAIGASQHPVVQPLDVGPGEPLMRQLRSFLRCVRDRRRPRIDGRDALGVLRLALRIREAIERHASLVSRTLATES